MAEVSPSTQRDIQSSTQYAENERLLDPLLKKEEDLHLSTHARALSFSTILDPAKESILHFLSFSLPRTLALFFAPQGLSSQTSTIFSYQILPSFGPLEALEEKRKRLYRKKKKKKGSQNEEEVLEKMLNCLISLEEDFSLFMGLRDHFQKG